MNIKYSYVSAFFILVALVAFLLTPTRFDAAVIFRNSALFGDALLVLDKMEQEQSGHPGVPEEIVANLFQSGRYTEAAFRLEGYLEEDPDQPEQVRRLAGIYSAMQLPDEAMGAYERLLEIVPADSQALYRLDEYYRFLQIYAKAEKNLETIAELFPADLDKREGLTELYIQTGQQDKAIELLQRTIELFPDSLEARLQLGEVYLYSNDSRALEALEKLHLNYPDRVDVFDMLMAAMSNFGRVRDVPERFHNYYQTRLEPDQYFQRLQQLILVIPEARNVVQLLEEQVKAYPSERGRFLLASLYQSEEMYDLAVIQLRQLIAEKPDNQDYWKLFLYLLWEEKYKDELVEGLERYCSKWTDDLERRLQLAEAYNWVEKYIAERDLLIDLVNLDSANLEYRKRLGQCYFNLADSAEYKTALLAAVGAMAPGTVEPEYVESLFKDRAGYDIESALILAELYEQGENSIRAEYYYRQSLEIEPDNSTALAGLTRIIAENKPQETLELLAELEKQNPKDYQLVYHRAQIYELLKNETEAAASYKKFLELARPLKTRDNYLIRQLARAYVIIGEEDRALELLREGRELFPDDVDLINDYAETLISRKKYDEAMIELDRINTRNK
jgi:tetratricopeptide (TPR) repeat protein